MKIPEIETFLFVVLSFICCLEDSRAETVTFIQRSGTLHRRQQTHRRRQSMSSSDCDSLEVVSRQQWGARSPKSPPTIIPVPVNMTFMHHSAGDWRGTNLTECIKQVQSIQNFHMDVRGWDDIGYSFLICEDGRVYEGRGWNVQGAHTLGYNSIAIGICIIGNYMTRLPLPPAITAAHQLLACGVEKGFIKEDYELFGHRDGRLYTECPGDELYELIHTWKHYSTRHIHKYGNDN